MPERHDVERKRQILLRFEQALDKYLSGEIDGIHLDRRGSDKADHLTVVRQAGYTRIETKAA